MYSILINFFKLYFFIKNECINVINLLKIMGETHEKVIIDFNDVNSALQFKCCEC